MTVAAKTYQDKLNTMFFLNLENSLFILEPQAMLGM